MTDEAEMARRLPASSPYLIQHPAEPMPSSPHGSRCRWCTGALTPTANGYEHSDDPRTRLAAEVADLETGPLSTLNLVAEEQRRRTNGAYETAEMARLRAVLAAVEALTKDTDGGDIDGDADIPIGEIRRVLHGAGPTNGSYASGGDAG
jgi:hypothetical protein